MPTNPVNERLVSYRDEIDACDAELVAVLARRFNVTEKVGQLKACEQLPAADLEREAQQKTRIRELASIGGLDPDLAERVWRVIVDAVKERHMSMALQREM